VGYKTAQGAEQGRALTEELAMKEREIKVQIADLELATKIDQFEKDIAEKRRHSDITVNAGRISEQNRMSIAENQISVELQRLGFQHDISSSDTYLSVSRLVHDQQMAEVELIRSFSDRLLGEAERDRLFALFVLSAYVSPEVIGRLASGGEEIISTQSLEKLAAIGDYQISTVAKSTLERRKVSLNAHDTEQEF